ncbi:UDP-N-acetyl-D-mannosamine dehydrogenase [Caloranaerobacter ferrireducens]|uniref:UDP-N-acetyl-D-mannosamine dehydrogenase n=1 Tax=Caloranaerobacter ferrireducens TaxID=1323370 RepID=UPI00084D3F5C|nr:UDP-N-acetyl-D-mannosamine dehydrogenase [Caloranaerobacter ferrireducens]
MKKICVVGLGYIGLPTAAIFALSGHQVIGVDINEKVVEKLNKGEVHIEEPGLDKVVKMMVDTGKIIARTSPEESDVFIIAVPTPNKNDKYKSCDLSYVLSAVKSIIPYIKNGDVIIVESTIAPRTTDDFIKPIIEEAGFKVGQDVYLAHCPERVLPGKIMEELVENNRIVGGCTPKCAEKAAEVYRNFVKGEILITDAKTAEMSKLMENTFRDVNIALANELVKVCNSLDINALEVIRLANKHPRVNLHQPGPGVGGHCLAVDPYFIIEKAPELARIISLARETNNSMPHYVVSKVKQMTSDIKDPKIAILGITYKGNIDDMRESPALEVIELLKEEGFEVAIHDPHVNTDVLELVSLNKAVRKADMILILADHNEFKTIDYNELAKEMRTPLVFDTKNIINIKDYTSGKVEIRNLGNVHDVKMSVEEIEKAI